MELLGNYVMRGLLILIVELIMVSISNMRTPIFVIIIYDFKCYYFIVLMMIMMMKSG